MTSKTSLLNGGIFKYNIKRFWWISAIYAFLLFLVAPYDILNSTNFYSAKRFYLNNYCKGTFLLILIAAILGICITRYLQKTRSATLFHALPVKRTQLYLSSLLSGFVLLFVPILLNAIILLCMSLFGHYGDVLLFVNIAQWVCDLLLVGLMVLCYVSFVGIFTGSSVAQGIFAIILFALPYVVISMVVELLDGWLFGFTPYSIDSIMDVVETITPTAYPEFFTQSFDWWLMVLYGIYILFYIGAGLFFYHKRDVERAGDIITFSWLKPIFLYGVTFCTMLFGTMIFAPNLYTRYHGVSPSVFLFLLFALVGYAVAKMLLMKSFKIWRYYKGYVAVAVIILISYGLVDGTTFYGNIMPDISVVEKMYVGEIDIETDMEYPLNHSFGDRTATAAILSSPEDIAVGQKLHHDLISKGDKGRLGDDIYIAYQLKNGSTMYRRYRLRLDSYDELYDVYNTESAKDGMYYFSRLKNDAIDSIIINKKMLSSEQIESFLACIQRDIERLSYLELSEDNRSYYIDVDYYLTEEYIKWHDVFYKYANTYVNDHFTETIQWLVANGFELIPLH